MTVYTYSTWQKLKRGVEEFWRNVRQYGVFRACSIFWSNAGRDHTHRFDTGVPYGQWSDMRSRLRTVMIDNFLHFLEGEYLDYKDAIYDTFDLSNPKSTKTERVIYYLRDESNIENEPQADAAQTALAVYRYLRERRPRMKSIVSELKTRYTLREPDEDEHPLAIYPSEDDEILADRAFCIEEQIEKEDFEMLPKIANVIPWMWT